MTPPPSQASCRQTSVHTTATGLTELRISDAIREGEVIFWNKRPLFTTYVTYKITLINLNGGNTRANTQDFLRYVYISKLVLYYPV